MASIWETRCATSDPTPMNHFEQREQSTAESEEGRPLIKENTISPARARHRAGLACHRGWRVCGKQQGNTRR